MDFHCISSAMRPSNSSQTLWVAIPLSTKKQTAWTAQVPPKFLVGLQRSPTRFTGIWAINVVVRVQTCFEFFKFLHKMFVEAQSYRAYLSGQNLPLPFSVISLPRRQFFVIATLYLKSGGRASVRGGESNGILRLDTDDLWFPALWSVICLVRSIQPTHWWNFCLN